MKIEPVVRASLVDAVSKQIRCLIEKGYLKAGDRLPSESTLAEQLRVSRPVLREALRYLEALGLLNIQRGRGIFVGEIDGLAVFAKLVHSALTIGPKELLQVIEYRRVIECYAVRQAAVLAKKADLKELGILGDQIDCQPLDNLKKTELDFQFHLKLMEIGGNELMRNIMIAIQNFVKASMLHPALEMEPNETNQGIHVAIVRALQTRKPDAAEKAMKDHMDWVVKMLQRRSEAQEQSGAAG